MDENKSKTGTLWVPLVLLAGMAVLGLLIWFLF